MVDPAKTYSLITALMDFFGKKPEQTTAEFAQEIKALTEQDRKDLREMLSEKGYKLT